MGGTKNDPVEIEDKTDDMSEETSSKRKAEDIKEEEEVSYKTAIKKFNLSRVKKPKDD